MALTPGESDRLLLYLQGQLARARRGRGLRLNAPEATAYVADAICEMARDGLDLPTVRERASHLLSIDDVMPEVPDLVSEVRVEARFEDGTRLVVVSDPWGVGTAAHDDATAPESDLSLTIANEATTAIALSSHIHLAEVNPRLRLDRAAAFGRRLAIPAGNTVWIEAGSTMTVPTTLVRGTRTLMGNTGVINGSLDDPRVRDEALTALRRCGYLDIIEGQPMNDLTAAESAVPRLMDERRSSR